MEKLNSILRIQPKTTRVLNRKTRKYDIFKAKRIHYENREPLDEIQVETKLSDLERKTRQNKLLVKNQYMPDKWSVGGYDPKEFQENFDECIIYQQLVQRVGPGFLTQEPPLEWISLQEAMELCQVNEGEVNRWIDEGDLKVLQSEGSQHKLIYLDKDFYKLAFPKALKTPAENLRIIQTRMRSLKFKPSPRSYRKWVLPHSIVENLWQEVYSDLYSRSVLSREEDNKAFIETVMNVAEVELKNFPSPYLNEDISYYNVLLVRAKSICLGKPTLRYFTTEEAAYYLRMSEYMLISDVNSGVLTPMKTDSSEHYIFEKQQLLAYAGPSSNPITANERSRETLAWVNKEFQPEFYGTIPPDAGSRVYLSKEDLKRERKKIIKAFVKLSSLSLQYREQNLIYFNQLLYPLAQEQKALEVLATFEKYGLY
ncbi:MAG: hypothetical protein HOD43_04695 [Candidatus Marinimicrobia bacterium]|jgi:hypothetical protein|nr:hypothetical protein [Candidatus Neomarinimicrobiota bacterium]MBT4295085.1 hypothetical protein [Candidatus Neomarinimicrobiota bacterium]MBT6011308.1 hypothetical protein [Candidatus Neomarinimicrobiota bacterium]